jgi:hypothetical protein
MFKEFSRSGRDGRSINERTDLEKNLSSRDGLDEVKQNKNRPWRSILAYAVTER